MAPFFLGVLAAHSTDRWISGIESGRKEFQTAKEELLGTADLFELHNTVYSEVGPLAWEERVKPDFMRALTMATVEETGMPFPDWRDVVGYARAHPEEARRMLKVARDREKARR